MGWYEAIKDAGAAIEKLRNAAANQAMATVRMEGARLAVENVRLREENLALTETARLRQTMFHRDNVYWQKTAEGGEEGRSARYVGTVSKRQSAWWTRANTSGNARCAKSTDGNAEPANSTTHVARRRSGGRGRANLGTFRG